MDFSVKKDRIEFLQDGQAIDLGRTEKGQALGVKGWESSKCSPLWKSFCKAMGWVVEVKINGTDLILGRNSALNLIKRANLATVPENRKEAAKKFSNDAIKVVLEGMQNKNFVMKAPKPTGNEAKTIGEWQTFLKGMNHKIDENFIKQNFIQDGDKYRIDNMKLAALFFKFAPAATPIDKALKDALSQGLPAAEAAISGDAPVAAAAPSPAAQPADGNARIEAAIKKVNPKAIMESGHKELENIQERGASAAGGWRDGRYAFVLEKGKDKNEETWFLYVGSRGGNKVLEVGIKGDKFTAEGGDQIVHEFGTIEELVKAFDGKIDRVLQSPQKKR